ncbi:hypothetical protein KFL_015250010 [Klebsormidium nitens]|uniref:Arsenite methyltransferase n=1 Tax=Klebsormidium nitens TaxID=105231 RepID=A0A1Y1IRW4_KLENI|nr:hypothetical protein KFL_015250010 [Klebsormidium nitens]|eukprot:GAQ93433.1 hypothetical protein KFL_015250010 [Klebsormidium nitens]
MSVSLSHINDHNMAVSSCCGREEPSNGTSYSASTAAAERKPAEGEPAAAAIEDGAGVGNSSQGADTKAAVQASVQRYYGEVLQDSSDLKTSACCTPNAPPKHVRDALRNVPDEVVAKYYGCGSPLPAAGLRVLDLGSGSGRDCYLAAALVGPSGRVIGVDMTDAQLAVARKYVEEYTQRLGYSQANLSFRKGTIEDLQQAGIADASVDLIISNCVVNLSPDKAAVLREAYRVLAPGGEFHFSDVYCDRRLPAAVRRHEVLLGECLGGALYVNDFKRLCHDVGFLDPRVLSCHEVQVTDAALRELVGEARFHSVTYRLFKLPGRLETACEDYGQVAIYKGSIPESGAAYQLDDHHRFEKGRPHLVCGNSAAMVGESWLKDHFEVLGDRLTHYGAFEACKEDFKSTIFAPQGLGNCC